MTRELKDDETYILFEDNGDDTCTVLMNIPQLDLTETVLIQLSMQTLLDMFMDSSENNATLGEFNRELTPHATLIPSDPEFG